MPTAKLFSGELPATGFSQTDKCFSVKNSVFGLLSIWRSTNMNSMINSISYIILGSSIGKVQNIKNKMKQSDALIMLKNFQYFNM